MTIHTLNHGIVDSNTYLVSEGNECAVIDCGVRTKEVINTLNKNGLIAKFIILTHCHFDHIYHAGSLKEATGAKICLHESDLSLYHDPYKNGFGLFGMAENMDLAQPDIILHDGTILNLSVLNLKVIHTPGHTPGSICILAEDNLFSGDTLFSMSVGRTDLPGGSTKSLNESIKGKLFLLDDNISVYPGHGPKTTIGHEKAKNPYV